MKTVLVATHQVSFGAARPLYLSVGVLSLAAALKKRNLPCEIADLVRYHGLAGHDDDVLNSIVKNILSAKPGLLGFSTMTNNLPVALELAARVKNIQPDLPIVFGGPGTAFCAQEVLENFPQVDAIFRGESEIVFPDFVESLVEDRASYDLPGLVYRANGLIADNGWPEVIPDLDELPFPDYPFEGESFLHQTAPGSAETGAGPVSIEIGRGCPYRCSFCSTSTYFSRKYRLKSTDRVIEEILAIHQRLGPVKIIFNHDVFTLKRSYVLELCRKIRERVGKTDWLCLARLNTLDEELCLKMHEAGCNEIFVGLESATEKIQRAINKKLDLDKFNLLVDVAKRTNLKISVSFIVGFPEEDDNDARQLLAYALKSKYICRDKIELHLNALIPMAGTPLLQQWKDKLSYDEYGSSSTTNIPLGWTNLRNLIKAHPAIFPVYFHLDTGSVSRVKALKYQHIAAAIESILARSIRFAFEWLNETLADIIVRDIDRVVLPDPWTEGNPGSVIAADSLREVIFQSLEDAPAAQKIFDAMARYEIARFEIQQTKKTGTFRIIEVFFNPLEMPENLPAFGNVKPTFENLIVTRQPLYYLILWDENERRVKTREIPAELLYLSEASR